MALCGEGNKWDNTLRFDYRGTIHRAVLNDDGTVRSFHLYDGLDVWPKSDEVERGKVQKRVDALLAKQRKGQLPL